MPKTITVDTNFLLDILETREPWVADVRIIVSLAERNEIKLVAAAHSFSTAWYVMRRLGHSDKKLRSQVEKLHVLVNLLPISDRAFQQALETNHPDLEDLMILYAAREFGCDFILSRDRDFPESSQPMILSPKAFLVTWLD